MCACRTAIWPLEVAGVSQPAPWGSCTVHLHAAPLQTRILAPPHQVLFNGEVVAAKEMDLEASAAMQEAFLKEAVWLHALRHPNIVGEAGRLPLATCDPLAPHSPTSCVPLTPAAFYGCCIAGSRGIVLMELCEGKLRRGSRVGGMGEGEAQGSTGRRANANIGLFSCAS